MAVLKCVKILIFFIVVIGQHDTLGYMLGNDPTRRAEYLDPEGKYLLEWEVLWSSRRIIFNVTVQTRGYVGFGFSNSHNDATLGGSDILIAGVLQHNKAYFLDHHQTIGNKGQDLRLDPSQDYTLHTAWESKTHTFISFSRPLDTCDPHDYPLTDNKVSLVWAYGEEDNHEHSWKYRKWGTYEVYLLDQDYSPKIERSRENGEPRVISNEKLSTWSISKRTRIPSNETSYLCSMHRGPKLRRKHHIVGIDVHFSSIESRDRVHHLIIYKCNAPQGLSPGIFEPFVGGQDQVCYTIQRPSTNGAMPTHFCTELLLGWAVGGRSFFLPPHVGLPLASSQNEYYVLQVHYDNPEQRSNLLVDVRLDLFFTPHLRSHEGGVMGIGHNVPGLTPSFLIPPNSRNHRVFGHCSPECTQRIFTHGNGIKMFAAILHSHNSGRRIRLHHFGGKNSLQEHPWILSDDNYSNRFQQFRHLHEERKILPGDQITIECSFDTTWNNGSTVVGGYSTRQEMCLTFVMYYNRIWDYSLCRSEIVSDEFRQKFLGVRNVTWVESQLNWVATDRRNGQLTGLTEEQISDNYVNWGRRRREELQRFHEVHPHVGSCSRDLYARSPQALQALMQSGVATAPMTQQVPVSVSTPDDFSGVVGYPHRIRPYMPLKTCSYRGGWSSQHPNKQFYRYY